MVNGEGRWPKFSTTSWISSDFALAAGGDGAGQAQLVAEEAAFLHHARCFQHVLIPLPARAVTHLSRRGRRIAAVQPQLLVAVPAGRAQVGQAAGSEQAAEEDVQPAQSLRLVVGGVDFAVGRQVDQVRAPETGRRDVHPAVGQDAEAQPCAGVEVNRRNPFGAALIQDDVPSAGDLVHVADAAQDLCAGVVSVSDTHCAPSS